MDLKLHLGATTRMAQKVREESPLGVKVHQCSRKVDHPYEDKHPMRPCVVNTEALKCCDGATPLLEKMEHLLCDIVTGHLEELLEIVTTEKGTSQVEPEKSIINDKRVKHSKMVGFSDTQAKAWDRTSNYSHATVGLIDDFLTKKCLQKIGLLMNFLCNEFVEKALLGTQCDKFFSIDRDSTLFSTHLKKIQERLLLPEDLRGNNLADNMQFNFGRPDGVSGHCDSKDDTRRNRDGHVTACVAIPIKRFKASDRALLAERKLVDDGLAWITAIAFTRKAVGDQAAKNDGKPELKNEVERIMHEVLTSDADDLMDVELLDKEHSNKLQSMFQQARPLGNGNRGCRFTTCLEGRRKEFFYASSQHAALELLARHDKILPRSYNTLLSILMIVGHQNGQHLQYSVLSKWGIGKFTDKEFEDGWNRHDDLYVMFCHELVFMEKQKKGTRQWLGTSTEPRFGPAADILYRPDLGGSLQKYYKRRAAFSIAIQASTRMLAGHAKYEREVSRQVLAEFKKVGGVGHLFGQQFVQFAARLGLLPVFLCEFGAVNGDKKSLSGPSLFMRSNCHVCSDIDEGCDCSAENIENRFFEMVDTLREKHCLNINDMICENSSCLQSRMSRVEGDKRKKDLIFWDGEDFNSIQNFVMFNSKSGQSTGGKMIIIYAGKKRALEDVFAVNTATMEYWIANPDKAGCYEWRIPKWAPTLPKTKKVWYPKNVFSN
jgi:hypothetical protein